jgi:hypothetical protein
MHRKDDKCIQNFRWKIWRGGKGFEEPVVDARIILKWVLKEWDAMVWTGLNCFRRGTSNGLL